MNLYDIFAETARRQPHLPAVLGPAIGDALTYGELDDAIGKAAAALMQADVQPGDCIGLHCPSGAAYIILNYAVWKCGGCVVPIPTELTAPEKKEIFQAISLRYLLSDK